MHNGGKEGVFTVFNN